MLFFVLNVLVAVACSLGAGVSGALFFVSMLTSMVDELISGYVALIIVWALAYRGFALASSVRKRLGMVWNAPRDQPSRYDPSNALYVLAFATLWPYRPEQFRR